MKISEILKIVNYSRLLLGLDTLLSGSLLIVAAYGIVLAQACNQLRSVALPHQGRASMKSIEQHLNSNGNKVVMAESDTVRHIASPLWKRDAIYKEARGRESFVRRFGAILRESPLNQIEIGRLEDLLCESPLLDRLEAAEAELDADPAKGAALFEQSLNELVSEVNARFNESVAARLRDEILSSELRKAVGKVAFDSGFGESPMGNTEGMRLMEVFRHSMNTDAGNRGTPFRLDDLDWGIVMETAKSFLTPVQQKSLAALAAKASFDREYHRLTGVPGPRRLP